MRLMKGKEKIAQKWLLMKGQVIGELIVAK